MAKLSEFLGELVSSISNARVNSDLQSLLIAKEYAKNNLLQHFAVPRMRVDKVELNIPAALEEMIETKQTSNEPIDNKSFSSIAYQQILKTLNLSSLTNEVSKSLKTDIAEHIHLLEAKLNVGQQETALAEFCKDVAVKVIEKTEIIYKAAKRKQLSKEELLRLQDTMISDLKVVLANEIKIKPENRHYDSLQVIVEAARLHEIKPENMITIKMSISEQGMEWIKLENDKGEVVNKLMPE